MNTAYNYETERPALFTDAGQRGFLKVRDNVHKLLDEAGAFSMGKAIGVISGDVWFQLACVDRLVELGEIREVTPTDVAGQDRVFVRRR